MNRKYTPISKINKIKKTHYFMLKFIQVNNTTIIFDKKIN